METEPREIYSSSNGDRWLLLKEADRLVVRHVPNPSSGGQSTQFDLEAFLLANRNSPQGMALIEMVG